VSWQSPKGNPWSWIDPGAFALVGAGAFMSSVTRLTVALAVIMVEISDDVHLLLPVLVAIMVAKWVADAATHSLYHALLELKCVPFLLPEPVSKYSLDLLQVSAVMRKPVVTLKHNMKVGGVGWAGGGGRGRVAAVGPDNKARTEHQYQIHPMSHCTGHSR
jgi:chloride channel 7